MPRDVDEYLDYDDDDDRVNEVYVSRRLYHGTIAAWVIAGLLFLMMLFTFAIAHNIKELHDQKQPISVKCVTAAPKVVITQPNTLPYTK